MEWWSEWSGVSGVSGWSGVEWWSGGGVSGGVVDGVE